MFQFFNDIQKVSRFSLSAGFSENLDGRFQSAVSIKSGSGAHSQDSIYTFAGLFDTAQEAMDHALREGMQLVPRR